MTTIGTPVRLSRASVLTISLALFAGIFTARLLVEEAAEPVMFLLVIPIGLLAAEFGLRGGFAAACLGAVLVVTWDLIASPVLTPFGFAGRFIVFFVTGITVGLLASSKEELETESSRWFEQSRDLNCVADFEGRFVRVNQAWTDTLGYTTQDLLTERYITFVHPDDLEETTAAAARLADGKDLSLDFENRYRKADGSYVWLRWTSSTDSARKLIYASARDVTSTKELEGELREMAQTDPLTGLFNRRQFEEEANRQLDFLRRYGSGGALFVFDIDNFKHINDTYGHAVGDETLVNFASAISSRIRGTDVAGRIGGDEFIILFPEVGRQQARLVGTALLDALAKKKSRSAPPISASIGITLFAAQDDPDLDRLKEDADKAMYEAKRAGGNRFEISQPLSQASTGS